MRHVFSFSLSKTGRKMGGLGAVSPNSMHMRQPVPCDIACALCGWQWGMRQAWQAQEETGWPCSSMAGRRPSSHPTPHCLDANMPAVSCDIFPHCKTPMTSVAHKKARKSSGSSVKVTQHYALAKQPYYYLPHCTFPTILLLYHPPHYPTTTAPLPACCLPFREAKKRRQAKTKRKQRRAAWRRRGGSACLLLRENENFLLLLRCAGSQCWLAHACLSPCLPCSHASHAHCLSCSCCTEGRACLSSLTRKEEGGRKMRKEK